VQVKARSEMRRKNARIRPSSDLLQSSKTPANDGTSTCEQELQGRRVKGR